MKREAESDRFRDHHDNSGSEGGSGEAEGDDECEGCRPPGGRDPDHNETTNPLGVGIEEKTGS